MVSAGIRKWFELLGVVPLGVYLVIHLATYARVLFGASSFGIAVSPGFLVVDLLLLWLPLGIHAAIGLRLSFEPLKLEVDAERSRSLLLRVTGMLSLLFLFQHALWLRWPLISGALWPNDINETSMALLSSTWNGIPLTAALHLVGLALVTSHFGWGLGRFLERWGILRGSRARPAAGWFAAVLFALGAATIVELATGSFIPRFMR
jgi:succinate dehydrogenase / fumarate reductase, cytochrome b subunit